MTFGSQRHNVSIGMEAESEAKSRGRPRCFDAERALDAALATFWKNGYEGTSLDDLTAAMGINRPSLYAAFGNKERLFARAVDRYIARATARVGEVLAAPTARVAVERYLREVVVGSCDSAPAGRGCLLVGAALTCSSAAEGVRQHLVARRADNERLLRERLERGLAEGDLPRDANAADLARFVTTIMQGLSVHAAAGATREQQLAVVDVALRAWPAAPETTPSKKTRKSGPPRGRGA